MDFLRLQNSVLSDRFGETRREDAKDAINARYGRVWGAEAWSFKYALVSYPLTSGLNYFPKGVIFRPIAVFDNSQSGYWKTVVGRSPEDFFPYTSSSSAFPIEFSVIGDNIYLDRAAPTTTQLQVYGELAFVPLENDGDVPLIPQQFHLMLSQGAAADLLKIENDPSYKPLEEGYQQYLDDMRRSYLSDSTKYDAWPSWP